MVVNANPFDSTDLPLSELHPDPQNPRLPEGINSEGEDALIEYIANTYDALTVARSIALYDYFPSEPLICLSQNGSYLVVEGNRRLAALILLSDGEFRDRISLDDEDEWEELSNEATLPSSIPAIVVPDRRSVAPIIGYRHISGIEPWDPWAKARFIAGLIESDSLSFKDVGNEVGESQNSIQSHFRNYRIVTTAKEKFGLNTELVENNFGTFTRAMNSLPLRQHIGAPSPGETSIEVDPVPDDKSEELSELLVWLFGDRDTDKAISESRDITKLGKAVDSPDGLLLLRETGDLEEAFIAAGGMRDALLQRLNRVITNLEAALHEVHEYTEDEEVITISEKCYTIACDLLVALGISNNLGDNHEH